MSDNRKRRVYVTNFAGHDFQKAEKFGELHFLTRGNVDFSSLDRVKYTIAESIATSEPDDYVALSGSSFIASVTCVLWMIYHQKINILNYDKLTGDYREFRMSALAENKMISDILEGVVFDG